ncbi:MAG: hypothetical protein PHW73_12665 [Atribacterota bacterium]|nr:hypothetical protein [Atribacterota bacterium]
MGIGDRFEVNDYVFCSFINDDGTQKEGFFFLVDINVNSITLKTLGSNIILIPIMRVLKLKKEGMK